MNIGRRAAPWAIALALIVVAGAGMIALSSLLSDVRPTPGPSSTERPSVGTSGLPGDGSQRPPVPATTAPATVAPASPGAVPMGGEGFPWSFALPDDPPLRRLVVMGSEIWIAGEGDRIRGVFAGPIDTGGEEPTLDLAAGRLQRELAQIPGSAGGSDPTPVQLPAGPAMRVTARVNDLDFTGFAVIHAGAAYRLVIAGYPDPVVDVVAQSLAFR